MVSKERDVVVWGNLLQGKFGIHSDAKMYMIDRHAIPMPTCKVLVDPCSNRKAIEYKFGSSKSTTAVEHFDYRILSSSFANSAGLWEDKR